MTTHASLAPCTAQRGVSLLRSCGEPGSSPAWDLEQIRSSKCPGVACGHPGIPLWTSGLPGEPIAHADQWVAPHDCRDSHPADAVQAVVPRAAAAPRAGLIRITEVRCGHGLVIPPWASWRASNLGPYVCLLLGLVFVVPLLHHPGSSLSGWPAQGAPGPVLGRVQTASCRRALQPAGS